MPARVVFWVVGLAVGTAAGGAVSDSLFPGVRPVVFGSAFLLIGIIGEVVNARTRQVEPTANRPRDTRPADGLVDLARVPGLTRTPNPLDPRFGAFTGLDVVKPMPGALPLPAIHRSPPLLGRVVLVSMFLGRDGRPWSDSEIAEAHRALVRAGGWVEGQAQRFGANVNLEIAETYFVHDDDEHDEVAVAFNPEGDDVGPFEERAGTKAVVSATRAAAALGFRDLEDLSRTVADRVRADATVWLIHPRRAGRSFALPVEDSGLRGVGLAVCYPRESSFPEPLAGAARADPVTLVHELLHLFGATDKYGRSLRDFAHGSVSSREVMRLNETRLARLRVDAFTAFEIGWAPQKETAGDDPEGHRRPSRGV